MNGISKHRCQGITLIEVLIVLGILVIVVSFASASAGNAAARADMRAASENLQYSISAARNTARMAETSVAMHLPEQPLGTRQRITFSFTDPAMKNRAGTGIPDYQLDEEIRFVSDLPAFEFDSRGIVKNPGQITLVSTADKSVTSQFLVE